MELRNDSTDCEAGGVTPDLKKDPRMVELVARWAAQPPERREAFLQEHFMAGISDQLRRAISKSGETYYALAQRTGVDAVVISRFVNGERDLRLETAAKLAAGLGLELLQRKRPN